MEYKTNFSTQFDMEDKPWDHGIDYDPTDPGIQYELCDPKPWGGPKIDCKPSDPGPRPKPKDSRFNWPKP